jgi:uncharacterized SAM-binding protein YcdF (DUF218 family)
MITTFLIFIISTVRDRRRFRNGVFFLLFLIAASVWLLWHFRETPAGSAIAVFLALTVIFLVLIVPVLLLFNGLIMIRREGFSLSNLLSFLFAIVIFAGEYALITGLYNYDRITAPWLRIIMLGGGYAVLYGSLIFLAFMFYTFIIRIIPRRADYDYVIVLGAGLLQGEKVSRLLADRIDQGLKVYQRSMSSCKIIVSGGQGRDEKISEAEAMRRYLLEKGVKEYDIILEDESTDTYENLRNSQEIIRKRGGRQYTAVVTSNYHILRAMIYAASLSFPITGIGSRTALYYWPSAMIREYAALVKYYFFLFMAGYLSTAGLLLVILVFF